MIQREQLKASAKEQIKGKIGTLFVISLIVYVIVFLASLIPIAGALVNSILLAPAFSLSLAIIYLKLTDNMGIAIGDVFDGFYNFWGAFKITFLIGLFTFLWSLLLVVPGIIKGYSYSMAIYIYAENKEMGALEAISESKKMMHGHKMDLFVLYLSFIGWILLVAATFGIASIYVTPYMTATMTNFYKSIKPVTEEPIEAPIEAIIEARIKKIEEATIEETVEAPIEEAVEKTIETTEE
ncbi:MAG: DUF975 family protein [Eubacteriales bacterium]|nr:DUF975 family protein [Eubacteriales bacterium]